MVEEHAGFKATGTVYLIDENTQITKDGSNNYVRGNITE